MQGMGMTGALGMPPTGVPLQSVFRLQMKKGGGGFTEHLLAVILPVFTTLLAPKKDGLHNHLHHQGRKGLKSNSRTFLASWMKMRNLNWRAAPWVRLCNLIHSDLQLLRLLVNKLIKSNNNGFSSLQLC